MKFVTKNYKNGLKLLTNSTPSLASTTIAIWVRTGSRFETKRIAGISHFLEHMVFKGSKKRPSARAIAEAVDSFGGEFNAGTSKEWTNFYIKTRNEKVDFAYDVLSDMVLNPLLKSEEIEKEKGTIIQEIAMYEDTPLYKISDVFENLIYSGTKLEGDVIGTAKTVSGISRNDFLEYRKKHYKASNIFVSVSGGADMNRAEKLTSEYFSGLPSGTKFTKPSDKMFQSKPQTLIKYKKTDQTHIMIGYRGMAYDNKMRYVEGVLSTILGGGMSSRMFTEVREKRGLCYAIYSANDHNYDSGYVSMYAGLKTEKISEAIKLILNEYMSIANRTKKISKKELTKAKEYMKGHTALSLEDTKGSSYFAATDELYLGRIRTPEEIYSEIDKVNVDEIYDLARKLFVTKSLNLSIIGPFKDNGMFVKLIK